MVTLPSHASLDVFPNNKTSEYRVKLPQPLTFQGKWEVGLTTFGYSKTWFNLATDENYLIVVDVFRDEEAFIAARDSEAEEGVTSAIPEALARILRDAAAAVASGIPEEEEEEDGIPEAADAVPETADAVPEAADDVDAVPEAAARVEDAYTRRRFRVESGHYETVEQLIQTLNALEGLGEHLEFSYSKVQQKVTMKVKSGRFRRLRLSNQLAGKLGWPFARLEKLVPDSGETFTAPSVANLDEIDLIYVYCDMAADRHIVGNRRTALLKTVSVKGEHGDRIQYEPRIVDWFPLRCNVFETVSVLITDGRGKPVPFEKGACTVTVHVRRARPF